MAGATSSLAIAGVYPDKRLVEFADHIIERQSKGRAASDQDIIVAAAQIFGVPEPYQFAQSAPDSVAFHSIAHLPRHCEADAHAIVVRAPPGLQYECVAGSPQSDSGSAKVRSALQPIHLEQRLNGKGAPVTH